MAKERIVVVDDDPGMRRMLSRMLESLGHEVLTVESPREVLALAQEWPVDLVVSDLKMPEMDGLALLRTLRERGHDSAFILVTAFGDLEAAFSARERYELSNFSVKPIASQDKFLFDVTSALRKRRLELENQRLIAELEAANEGLERKVEARTRELQQKNVELTRLSNFRADVLKVLNHELRTPISILKGYLGLDEKSAEPVQPGGERRQSTHVMRAAVDRVQEIVDQAGALKLGTESAPPEIVPVRVDPVALVRSAVGRLRPLVAPRRIEITVEAPSLPDCCWDAGRIGTVIEELLTNAVRASPDGTAIGITVGAEGPIVEIAVHDEGEGIPPEERQRIFEPFVTLGAAERHRSGRFQFHARGAGLGLAVAKLWVELHHGEIIVHESTPGHGTTMLLRIPRKGRDASAMAGSASA